MTDKIKVLFLILPAIYFSFGFNNAAFPQDIQINSPVQNYDPDILNQNIEDKDQGNIYYNEGLDFLKSDQYTSAIDSLEKALNISPKTDNTRVNLAVAYINRGTYFYNHQKDFSRAANDYRNAIYLLKYDQIIPNIPEASENLNIAVADLDNIFKDAAISSTKSSRLKIARELRGQGKFREALVEFNVALAGNQTDFPVYTAIGDLYSALDNNQNAVKYYKKAVAQNSGNIELRLKLAKSLHNSGEAESAVKEYNIALNTAKDEDKIQVLNALQDIWIKKLQENPQDAVAHMNLGVVLQKKEDFDGALKEYQIAQSINPNDITLRLNIGTLYQSNNDFTTAIKAYDSIIEVKPDYLLAHYYRGTALKEIGQLDSAVKEFQLVLSKDPTNTDAKIALFDTIKLLPNPQDVTSIFKTFAVNNPADSVAQYKYAYQLHSTGNIDEAITYYKKAITINPKLTDAYLNMAVIYKQKKQPLNAIYALENGLKASPKNQKLTEMLNSLNSETATGRYQNAINLYNQGKYNEAVKEYLSIINISEPDSDLYVNLGAAYQASKKLNEAVNSYKKATEINNKNSTAFYYLGTVYSAQDKNAEAVKAYTKALALDPSNKDIKKALEDSKVTIKKTVETNALQKGIDEYSKGKYTEAILTFNTLAMKSPQNSDVYYYRGMVYDALKKYQLAIADYKLAVKLKPELSYAYYAVAVDYDALNNRIEAKKWYIVFIQKSGSSTDQYAKYAKERIKQI